MKGRDKRRTAKANAAKRKGTVPWKKKVPKSNLDRIVAAVNKLRDEPCRS